MYDGMYEGTLAPSVTLALPGRSYHYTANRYYGHMLAR